MKNHRTFSQHPPAAVTLVMLMLWLSVGVCCAQESFVVPERYPQDRYETGWMKNPFTLKTAPVVVEKKSFAKDLVLHNIVRVGNEVTAVLANAKTKEFYRVKSSEPASNGMKIRSAVIKDARKDTYVEVELNGESAVLRHDEAFRKQMLAGNSARGNRGKGGAGAGAGEGHGKDATGQPVVTPGSPTSSAPGEGGAAAGRGAGMSGAGASATPRPPVERPPLPQRPGPTPPMPREPALAQTGEEQPVNIRPGGPTLGVMPPRGAPSRAGRRFFTAPLSTAPPATAPASSAP